MQDAELAQVVKKDPEIGKTIKLYHTITKNNTAVAGVSSMAGHWADWLVARMILTNWFDHLGKSFPYVQLWKRITLQI